VGKDLIYAFRTLRRTPVFTLSAVLTLALGVGANTAIFSVVNAELLRPLPFQQPDRLVWVAERNDKLKIPRWAASVLNYLSWREQQRSFEQLGAIGYTSFNLVGRGEPEQFDGSTLSPSVIPLLGIKPVAGRAFREGEDAPNAAPVAMIGEGLWKRRFGGDRALIGQTLSLNGIDYTVVGIAPPALSVLANGEIWTPLTINPARESRLNHLITVVGRLRPGVTVQQAQAEMEAVSAHVGQQFPEVKDWSIRLVTFFDFFVSPQIRTALLVLMGTVALVLLIACANVANLLLSRSVSRQQEVAVRIAIGASRFRLLRQFLGESLLLSLGGGLAGVVAAVGVIRLLERAVLPPNLLPIPDFAVDSTVLWFAMAVTLATGVIFGIAPAWHSAGADLSLVLKKGSRSSTGGAFLLRNALVAGELALATMLLAGTGLLLQSFLKLQRAPLGFQADNLLTFQATLPQARYASPAKIWGFYRQLLESLAVLPGTEGVAVSSAMPLGNGFYSRTPFLAPGKSALAPGQSVPIDWRVVSPDYFRTMRIPLFEGRVFTDADGPAARPVVVISRKAADKLWGADDPLGRPLRMVASDKVYTVAGIVGDARNTALDSDPSAAVYFPAPLRPFPQMDVIVRTAGAPDTALSAVRQVVHGLDSELPVANVRTMEDCVAVNAAQPRLDAWLVTVFAGVALLIAVVGVYGVLSWSVSRRTREIGVRMALGAQQGNVVGLILRQGMSLALAGIGLGLAGALAFSRVLSSLVFGIEVRDPATFAGVVATLAVAALAACYVPAWRASRLNPVEALREE